MSVRKAEDARDRTLRNTTGVPLFFSLNLSQIVMMGRVSWRYFLLEGRYSRGGGADGGSVLGL